MTAKEYQVCSGPSKLDLMLALFDRNRDGFYSPRELEFKLEEKLSATVIVHIVEAENGPDELWRIEGRASFKEDCPSGRILFGSNLVGWYCTQDRKGQLQLPNYS